MKRVLPIVVLWVVALPATLVASREHPTCAVVFAALLVHLAANVVLRLVGRHRYGRWAGTQDWTAEGTLPASVPISAGEGPDAVLLVHGFCDAAYVWKRQVARLAEAGFRVEAIQLKGFGVRGLPEAGLADWQTQLTDRITALASTHRRVFLAAHSFGCSLALDAAYRHGRYGLAPLSGLILFAPLVRPLPANRWGIPFSLQYALHCWLTPLPNYLPSMFRAVVKGEDDPGFTFTRDAFMNAVHLDQLMRMLRRLQKLDRSFVTAPVRVFLAGDDRLVDSDATRSWLAGTSAPCEISEVPGAKHALPTARSWRETCDAAVAFMTASL